MVIKNSVLHILDSDIPNKTFFNVLFRTIKLNFSQSSCPDIHFSNCFVAL